MRWFVARSPSFRSFRASTRCYGRGAAEQAALQAVTPVDYWPLFYLIWTRKEAYAKALGMGLTLAFREFSVLAPGQPLRLTAPAGASLLSFSTGTGWQGAVAVLTAGDVPSPRHFQYLPGTAGC